MKGRYLGLVITLAASMAAFAAVGVVETQKILKPLELDKDAEVLKVPFLLATDESLKTRMEIALELKNKAQDAKRPDGPSGDSAVVSPEATEGSDEPSQIQEPPTSDEPSQVTEPSSSEEPSETPEPPTSEEPSEIPEPPSSDEPTQAPEPPTSDEPEPSGQGPDTAVKNPDLSVWELAEHVDDSWFDDALFIGDSRTVGLRDYCRTGNADYFCSVGMSVFNFAKKVESDKNFPPMSLEELLGSRTYGKIIISLGINECGYPLESLSMAYARFVNRIRELQPGAKIILQGIMAVSRAYTANGSYFGPENLGKINRRISEFADGENVFYLDINSAFADSDGFLPSYMSFDGCHLYIKYYQEWMNWLKASVVHIPV